ncbi:MAG TPA: Rieske 2Fe-2S domain-containing protein [Streptosporangiaceae bacterium]|nr:Rieske 2Fe-2S domain-containing protein [Streptosporangiaceae bacterium]
MRSPLAPARRPGTHRKPGSGRRPAALAERVEQARVLDPVVRRLSDGVVRALPAGPRTDALHGVPFGQPVHPTLVRLPLGCWTSAVLLDLFRGTDRASRVLIGAGLAGTVPTAATGLADWSALHTDQQRVGLVHAVCQSGAAALFLGSLAARASGRRGYGRLLSGFGLAVAAAGSYLGGHLALRLGAGANHAETVSHLSGLGWHDLCRLGELPDRHPVRRQLGYLSLLVYRQGSEVSVLSDRCSHLGGPLHQGRVVVERAGACIACPWHGSTFAVSDGAVVHGPATARQPSFETRVTADGRVELRARP